MNTSNIFNKQDNPFYLSARRAAQRLYFRAKLSLYSVKLVTVIISIGLLIAATCFCSPQLTTISACLTIIIFLADYYVESFSLKLKKKAASIQHYIEQDLFGIERTDPICYYCIELDEEAIVKTINKYDDKKYKKVKSWYKRIEEEDIILQINACQKESIKWEIKLRRYYYNTLLGFILVLVIGLAVFCTFEYNELSTEWFVLIACFVPLFKMIFTALSKLKTDIESIARIEGIKIGAPSKDNIRISQIYLYEYRCNAIIIPSSFYRLFKRHFENSI